MYKNIPERENPNDIDHYLRYAELERITETLYARALRKMVNIWLYRQIQEQSFLMVLIKELES
jgi:hypothetical protein